MSETGHGESLSGPIQSLAIEEGGADVLSSSKVAMQAPKEVEEEEEDTGEVVKVNFPRKGQEAPFEAKREEAENVPPPRVIVHHIEVEEPPSASRSKKKPAASERPPEERRSSPSKSDERDRTAVFEESASREPIVSKDPSLTSEERIEQITQHKIWEAGEAAERFPAKAYTCRFCGLSYAYITTLKAHERVHDVDEPYKCPKCGQGFRFYSEYDYHLRSHKDQKQYKCKCKRSFSLYTDLINHKCEIDCFLDDYKEPSPEPIHAPLKQSALQDKKSYAESRDLKYHMYSHRGERVFNVRSTSYQNCLDRDKIWKSDLDYFDWD